MNAESTILTFSPGPTHCQINLFLYSVFHSKMLPKVIFFFLLVRELVFSFFVLPTSDLLILEKRALQSY